MTGEPRVSEVATLEGQVRKAADQLDRNLATLYTAEGQKVFSDTEHAERMQLHLQAYDAAVAGSVEASGQLEQHLQQQLAQLNADLNTTLSERELARAAAL